MVPCGANAPCIDISEAEGQPGFGRVEYCAPGSWSGERDTVEVVCAFEAMEGGEFGVDAGVI